MIKKFIPTLSTSHVYTRQMLDFMPEGSYLGTFDYVISLAAIKDLMPNILPAINLKALQASQN